MAGGPLPRIPSTNNQDIYAFKPTLALFFFRTLAHQPVIIPCY